MNFQNPPPKKKQGAYDKFPDFFCMNTFIDSIIFTNPSARAGYDTRSIFKRSLTGLN